MTPILSIIVPVYNVEKYLDICISSILQQTFKDFEIILIDDGSPDNCPQLCDEYARKYDNIKVVHKQNAGLGMACNSGLEVASGKYVAFCDSDDYIDSVMYERMIGVADHYHADAVFTGLKRVNDEGKDLGRLTHYSDFVFLEGVQKVHSFINDMIASKPSFHQERQMQVSAKVVLYKMSIINEHNLRFVSERQYPSEDLFFNMDYLSNCNIVCSIPEYYYNYRCNPSSITGKLDTRRFSKLKFLYQYALTRCVALNLEGSKERVDRLFIGYVRSFILHVVRSSLPFVKKRNIISEVCRDDVWKKIKDEYPIFQMPLSHMIFTLAIIKRYTFLLILIAKSR